MSYFPQKATWPVLGTLLTPVPDIEPSTPSFARDVAAQEVRKGDRERRRGVDRRDPDRTYDRRPGEGRVDALRCVSAPVFQLPHEPAACRFGELREATS